MTATVSGPTVTEQAETFAGRLFGATLGSLELFSVYLGVELGLYAAMRDAGPLTPSGLARAANIDERYAREWLEQQAVAGYVETENAYVPANERRYALPTGHAEALMDPESVNYVVPFGGFLMCVPPAIPALLEAYRTGGDQPSAATGTVLRTGTVRRIATEAGFSRVDVVPIEHDFFRFYRLTYSSNAAA